MPDRLAEDLGEAFAKAFGREELASVMTRAATTVLLRASEQWQAMESVVRMAKKDHEHCDGKAIDEDEEAPCGMCAALARLDAVTLGE